MRTRISRAGKQQVLLGVWVDKIVYDELERTAKGREITVAELTRHLLARAIEAERHRPKAQQILNGLLHLEESEIEELRRQLVLPRQTRLKRMAVDRLRQTKLKSMKSTIFEKPDSKS